MASHVAFAGLADLHRTFAHRLGAGAGQVLRLVGAGLPVATLWLAKLILDAIVAEHARPRATPMSVDAWLSDPHLSRLAALVAAELALAILSDLIGRLSTLVDGLVAGLLEQRRLARARRDFAAADAIRDTLTGLGVEVSDTPTGTRWSLLAGSSH